MRKIAFKAWDKKLNVMYPAIVLTELLHYMMFQVAPNSTAYTAIKDHFEDIEWLEMLGMQDNKKNEVCEGDILASTVDPVLFNWLVEYKNGCMGIRNIGVDGYLMEWFPVDGPYYFMDRVIVGNKFQHPDLMKNIRETHKVG